MKAVNAMKHQRGQVLIAIFLGTLLFGGAAAGLSALYGEHTIKRLHKAVKAQVHEPARQKALSGIIDELGAAAEAYDSSHAKYVERLLDAFARHDTQPAEVAQILADLDGLNRFSRQALLERRMELRDLLSPAQWSALFAPTAPEAAIASSSGHLPAIPPMRAMDEAE